MSMTCIFSLLVAPQELVGGVNILIAVNITRRTPQDSHRNNRTRGLWLLHMDITMVA